MPDREDAIPEAVLRHPVREAIVTQLARLPGMNKNQLADALDLYPSLLDSHLHRLEEAGLVRTRRGTADEVVCFNAEDIHLWEDEDTRVLFGRTPPRRVALCLARHPGASTTELADALDLSPGTVRYHLRTLGEHDLIERVRIGRSVEYHPQETLTSWIDELGERYPGIVPEDDGGMKP